MAEYINKSKQIITLDDKPTTKDELGFTPYVIAIAEFLTNKDTKPPLTISIEGEWGSGKSSFMKQLETEVKSQSKKLDKEDLEKIKEEDKFFRFFKSKYWKLIFKQETQTVWFNPWRHEKSESLWATFALSFLEQLSKNRNLPDFVINGKYALNLSISRLNLTKKPCKTILKSIELLLLFSTFLLIFGTIIAILVLLFNAWFGVIPRLSKILADIVKTDSNLNVWFKFLFGSGSVGGFFFAARNLLGIIRDLIGDPKMNLTQYLEHSNYEEQVAFIEKFHEDFSKIVDAYVGKDEKVYVFIDDIDRCELDKSADLLQGLNMMISNDLNIIFILAMDREKVAAAISFKQREIIPFLASAIAENEPEENDEQKLSKKVDYGFIFLEKFVQLSFSVPVPSEKKLDSFVEKISEIQTETKTSPTKEHSVSEQNSESQEANILYPDSPIFPIIEKDLDQENLKLAIQTVADFLDYNPRILKQYINALRLRIYITYYSIGVTFAEKNTLNIEQISKFTALILKYPRLLLALKKNPDLLADLEKNALDTGNANYWLKNYPKIRQLLSSEMTLNNEQKSGKKYIFENGSIKKLLEVSPEQNLPPKYFKLREFLAAKKWKEADYETYQVMLPVTEKNKDSLEQEKINKFTSKDLQTINQLWVKYSDDMFGFSIQQEIYQSLGDTKEHNKEKLGRKVGWYINGSRETINYDQISDENGKIITPYRGHLPYLPVWELEDGWVAITEVP
ncbi:MAG: hypothetical protein F6K40_32500 [Okeania sp. SIO3I5]|uniref:P-loop NTPase fold protein n=1 Tax=Okeania sp. SIO3I5 TaxID=2607805 RepID=UPI0013B71CE0|nr:P-loop NTPase fold protein [Okeania sp. SIO3I5]NEQ40693.1 hypothetical protein [Okeania sp. SIO3I5]